ncbi:MAG: alkyl hydroperoxide reductase, partial [Verrucomicrobia bacterium]|nr:alkyl hydroperoxide reductase [Verrucomicrobiota bacterium]
KPATYTKDAAPILKQHCVGCHSAGRIGPFAMSGYEKVKGWAAMTREVLLEQRMPPWPADPEIGAWKGHRQLSLGETRTLLRWVAAGAPRGEGPDPLASDAPSAPADWPLGKPDYVLSITKPFSVPATGVIPYQYFEVENPIQEDAWLRAAVVRPGNPKVLHHALVFVKYPEQLKSIEPRQNGGTAGYFTGFVPGAEAVPFPEGTGKFLPKGTRIIFQIHYSPTGKPETDLTELGLYLLPGKPEWELRTRAITQTELLITPGERAHKTKAAYTFRKDAVLHSLSPHMHVRGSSFKYDLVYPDGKTETILSVPRWDFSWQTLYRFNEPKTVPAGTELICSGTFDNSANNPANPNPKQWVIFGEQTTDEMFIGYYDIAVRPLEPVSGPKPEKKKPAPPSSGSASSE